MPAFALQNLALALAAVVCATLPTVAGFFPLWLAVLLHEGSTLLVCDLRMHVAHWWLHVLIFVCMDKETRSCCVRRASLRMHGHCLLRPCRASHA